MSTTLMNGGRRLRWAPLWWTCGWVLMVLVVLGSIRPSDGGAPFPINDKVVHFSAYWMMAFWFAGVTEKRRYWVIAAGLLSLGALVEGLQFWMHAGRSAEWLDFGANSLGIASALAVAYAGLGSWLVYLERALRLSSTGG